MRVPEAVAELVRVEVKLVVAEVVLEVVGVVMVHCANSPPTKSLMALFSVLLVASQSELSNKNWWPGVFLDDAVQRCRGLVAVCSVALYSSMLSSPSALHRSEPIANGQAASILLTFTTLSLQEGPPKKNDEHVSTQIIADCTGVVVSEEVTVVVWLVVVAKVVVCEIVWYGMVWYGMVEVYEGAPVAVSGWVLTKRHGVGPCAASTGSLHRATISVSNIIGGTGTLGIA